jgi:serine/threonine-protein kinase RsbW
MTARRQVVELKIPCDPKFLSVVRLTVAGLAVRAEPEFTVDDVEDVKVSVTEACTNVIDHAFPPNPSDEAQHFITVRCTLERGGLTVEVSDCGCGFDLATLPAETEHGVPGESGLGVPLMRSLMDEVQFEGGPGRGTTVTMHKRPAR